MNSSTINNCIQRYRHLVQVHQALMPKPFGLYGKIWVILLVMITSLGLYFYIQQLRKGLIITGLRDYTIWGIYIANFVFLVVISLMGTLVDVILKLSNLKFR